MTVLVSVVSGAVKIAHRWLKTEAELARMADEGITRLRASEAHSTGYHGVIQAPDGTIRKIATSTKKNTGRGILHRSHPRSRAIRGRTAGAGPWPIPGSHPAAPRSGLSRRVHVEVAVAAAGCLQGDGWEGPVGCGGGGVTVVAIAITPSAPRRPGFLGSCLRWDLALMLRSTATPVGPALAPEPGCDILNVFNWC